MKVTDGNNGVFRNKDLYLCAFLAFRGTKLLNAERINGKVFFCFENDPKIQGFIREFTSGEISRYIREIYNLKTLLSTT